MKSLLIAFGPQNIGHIHFFFYQTVLQGKIRKFLPAFYVQLLMDVLLDAFSKLNGIQQYEAINVGFAIVQSLAAGKVDAVMGPFKTYETVTMAHKGYEVGYFELEKWGIPDYDELVFVTSKKTLNKKKAALKAFQRVIARAIEYVR
ncbi:ABC transporter substrate-binding protein, partial [Thermodesulfobacteriota bacterium]